MKTNYEAKYTNGNKNAQVAFVRTFNAYFVNTSVVNPIDHTSQRNQYRFESNDREAALKFASDFVK